jgi:hypothetical protein
MLCEPSMKNRLWYPTVIVLLSCIFHFGSTENVPVGSNPTTPALKPILDCMINDDTLCTAIFGYTNEHNVNLTVEMGCNNRFSPSPMKRGQKTWFAANTRGYFMFNITRPCNEGNVTWILRDPVTNIRYKASAEITIGNTCIIQQPIGAPVNTPYTNPPINPPVGNPLPQNTPTTPPVQAPTVPPVHPPANTPVNPPTNPPIKPPVATPVSAPITAPISVPTSPPVSAPVKAPVGSPLFCSGDASCACGYCCDKGFCVICPRTCSSSINCASDPVGRIYCAANGRCTKNASCPPPAPQPVAPRGDPGVPPPPLKP